MLRPRTLGLVALAIAAFIGLALLGAGALVVVGY
jgi:hypothetical protein